MTTNGDQPPPFTVQPSNLAADETIGDEYGPDPARDIPEPPIDAAEEVKKARRRNGKSPFNNLGNNKKRASGVRQLTKQDREKIEQLYVTGAMVSMPFKPDIAKALANAAEDCAEAWFELSKENDGVRRTILMLIEGGAWGKVFAAHLPIFLAAIPNGIMPPGLAMMMQQPPTEETPDQ